MRPGSAILSATLLAAGAATVLAQQQTPPPTTSPRPASATQARPQFSAGVDLVEVDVSVTDKNGQPVTDLTAADFDIREDGQSQTIQTIYLASLDRKVLDASATTSLASGTAKRPERREMKQRVFVFMLDMNHLSAAGFTRSRDAILDFLKDQFTPSDLVGIVANGKMLGNRITGDRDALQKTFADVKTPNLSRFAEMRSFPRILDEFEAAKIAKDDQPTIDAVVRRGCAEQPGECNRGGDEGVRQQVEEKGRRIAAETMRDTSISLTELQSLANGLARIPGPKQVVVFSEGFYTDDTSEWLKTVVGLAARNGVHFSTFDARGIGKDERMQSFLGPAPLTLTGELTSLSNDANADVLTSLALDTGGDRVFNYNNFREPLDRLARETSTYYMLGYRPAKAFDDSYRKLEVTVRRPDVVVRARRGYLAARSATGPAAPEEPSGATASTTPSAVPIGTVVDALPLAVGKSGIMGAPRRPDESGLISRPDSVGLVTVLASSGSNAGRNATPEATQLARDGWQLYAKGHVEEAREKLASAAAASPNAAWIQYALGQAEFALQHLDAAVQAFDRVRHDLPDYEPVYFDLADSYIQQHRQSDALTVLREAERRWPNDAETHLAAGCVLVARAALDDAVDAFNKAIAAAPDDGLGYFNLGRAYHFLFLRILRSTSSNPTATTMLADRNRERAIEAYKKYLAIGGPFEQQARDALAVLGWKSLQ
jgi:VWFA-related protein